MTHITTEQFETEVLQADQPVLVDFYAEWCPPCKMLAPTLEKLSHELAGKAKIVKVNVDQEAELAAAFRITSVPTMILFNGGQPLGKIVGLRSASELKKVLEDAAAGATVR